MTNELMMEEADRATVTVLVDNYTDLFLLESKGPMRRPMMLQGATPVAEHGLSVLIEVESGGKRRSIVMDAALSPMALLHNMTVYGVDMAAVECMVLSHGHPDHFGGLVALLGKTPQGKKLVLHPDAFSRRRLNIPGRGPQKELPSIDEAALTNAGALVCKKTGPELLCSGMAVALGEIERTTEFEKGFPWAEITRDGEWLPDPFLDDQAIAIRVKGKGLVVVSGCAHSGIVNTVRYAQKIAGEEKVHAVMGGFHLTGPIFEPIIDPTVEALKEAAPDYVIPMHCTGWSAIKRFSERMPEQFLLNSVGTSYVFE